MKERAPGVSGDFWSGDGGIGHILGNGSRGQYRLIVEFKVIDKSVEGIDTEGTGLCSLGISPDPHRKRRNRDAVHTFSGSDFAVAEPKGELASLAVHDSSQARPFRTRHTLLGFHRYRPSSAVSLEEDLALAGHAERESGL